MEIAPVSLSHFTTTAEGRMVEVPDDVTNVARDLAALDPTLRLRYSEAGDYFVVFQSTIRDGQRHDHLVLTAQECDQRIVKRVEELRHPSYDLAADLKRVADDGRRDRERAHRDALEEHGDQLVFAARRQLGVQSRIYVP